MAIGEEKQSLAELLEALERVKYNIEKQTTSEKIQQSDKDLAITLWNKIEAIGGSMSNSLLDRAIIGDSAEEDVGAYNSNKVGHVSLATDTQAKQGYPKPPGRAIAVQPSQLPTVDSTDQIILPAGDITYQGQTIDILEGGTGRNEYNIALSSTFKTFIESITGQVNTSKANIGDENEGLTKRVIDLEGGGTSGEVAYKNLDNSFSKLNSTTLTENGQYKKINNISTIEILNGTSNNVIMQDSFITNPNDSADTLQELTYIKFVEEADGTNSTATLTEGLTINLLFNTNMDIVVNSPDSSAAESVQGLKVKYYGEVNENTETTLSIPRLGYITLMYRFNAWVIQDYSKRKQETDVISYNYFEQIQLNNIGAPVNLIRDENGFEIPIEDKYLPKRTRRCLVTFDFWTYIRADSTENGYHPNIEVGIAGYTSNNSEVLSESRIHSIGYDTGETEFLLRSTNSSSASFIIEADDMWGNDYFPFAVATRTRSAQILVELKYTITIQTID